MNDEELFRALKLNENDSKNLWGEIQPKMKSKVSLWEILAPLATAAIVLLIVHGLTHSNLKPVAHWPVHELVVPTTITLQGQ